MDKSSSSSSSQEKGDTEHTSAIVLVITVVGRCLFGLLYSIALGFLGIAGILLIFGSLLIMYIPTLLIIFLALEILPLSVIWETFTIALCAHMALLNTSFWLLFVISTSHVSAMGWLFTRRRLMTNKKQICALSLIAVNECLCLIVPVVLAVFMYRHWTEEDEKAFHDLLTMAIMGIMGAILETCVIFMGVYTTSRLYNDRFVRYSSRGETSATRVLPV
jgi:hypothetical protein